jgi:hypothetical protein
MLFALLLLLLQPGILLYNHMVMSGAAAEGCRLLVTKTSLAGAGPNTTANAQAAYAKYIERRLAAIPPLDLFHAHGDGEGGAETCWQITTEGDESSAVVSVSIVNRLKPLPLLGLPASLLGLCDENGWIQQEVCVAMPTQPSWVWENGGSPGEWVTQWDY